MAESTPETAASAPEESNAPTSGSKRSSEQQGKESSSGKMKKQSVDKISSKTGQSVTGFSAQERKSATASSSRKPSQMNELQESPSKRKSDFMRASQQLRSDMRKQSDWSYAKVNIGSIISFRKGSGMDYYGGAKVAKYANTYRLESEKPFHIETVERILVSVLTEALEELHYSADGCAKKAKWASNEIRSRIKELEFDRYKLVCFVTIGEKKSQDYYSVMKFLWDPERDKHTVFCLDNMQVFAFAVAVGLYYE